MWSTHTRITKTVKAIMPSVVSIVLKSPVDTVEAELKLEQKKIKNKKTRIEIPEDNIDSHGFVEVGGGSGFIVDSTGIILTNRHVIDDVNALYFVTTHDNDVYTAELLAKDPIDDIAILKISPKKKLVAVELGDSSRIELGETVLAFGNALGIFKDTVSSGIVSGLSRAVSARDGEKSPMKEMRGLIQTDAAINPGNSGGPLVDMAGCVIGINAAVVASAESISFAIPINAAKRDLKDLKKHGRIIRPLFGVRYIMLNNDLKEKLMLPANYGAYVTKENSMDYAVVPKSPAEKAGIREQDIILSWNGEKITDKTIQDFLENHAVGDTVKLGILRNKKEIECEVTLVERK